MPKALRAKRTCPALAPSLVSRDSLAMYFSLMFMSKTLLMVEMDAEVQEKFVLCFMNIPEVLFSLTKSPP